MSFLSLEFFLNVIHNDYNQWLWLPIFLVVSFKAKRGPTTLISISGMLTTPPIGLTTVSLILRSTTTRTRTTRHLSMLRVMIRSLSSDKV